MTVLFLAISASFIVCGCASNANQSALLNLPATDVTGEWRGITQVRACETQDSGRCNAFNIVKFSLVQRSSRISGKYACSYGNFECRHDGVDSEGYVQWGDIKGSAVRLDVLLPGDLSSCLYNGRVSADRIVGSYRCYAGGGIMEQGTWQITRKTLDHAPAF
jgi:hypothetical protein